MRTVRWLIRALGYASVGFGAVTVVWGSYLLLSFDPLARAALGSILGGMFFLVVGAAALVVSHGRPTESALPSRARWLNAVAIFLFACGIGAIALATVVAGMRDQFGNYVTGIVTYCMLTGIGLMIAAWGIKRAARIS